MQRTNGFGLLELMLTLAIVSLLVMVAIPSYGGYALRAKVARAIGDIGSIAVEIETFRLRNRDRVPTNLAELQTSVSNDPWGRAYVFLNIIDGNPNIGAVRKDGQLNPLNTDYDLYSLGKDGDSKGPLNAQASRDDIIRANNGAYIGLGEDY